MTRGIDVRTARIELREAIARPWTYEDDPRGELVGDRRSRAPGPRRRLGGRPLASEWIHYAALAIKAQAPLELLCDTVAQFPTYTEAYLKAIEKLDL